MFAYLLALPLRRSLLGDAQMSIINIALAAGFSGARYYGERFKQLTISPGEYRRKLWAGETNALPR